jgi:hypothetical protein
MVVFDQASLAREGWAAVAWGEPSLARRLLRGSGMALAAVLIPGYAATCGCAPSRRERPFL